jgi:hypothetical protein
MLAGKLVDRLVGVAAVAEPIRIAATSTNPVDESVRSEIPRLIVSTTRAEGWRIRLSKHNSPNGEVVLTAVLKPSTLVGA